MSVRETLIQAIRAWLRRTAVDDATDLAHARVIVADPNAPRPPTPYLTVRVSPGAVVGHDERLYDADGATGVPSQDVAGVRRAPVSVQGYGVTTADWLEEAMLGLGRETVRAMNRTAGISVELSGPVVDLSALLDTGIEPRFALDFDVLYAVRGGGEELTPMNVTEIAMTYTDRDGDTDPLTSTITVT